ncbi:hypothetical protein GQ53DRAFT_849576 [Thozetella sp. PMI_491]|nr:hypothetical protein GQ53DRAFT_849576 [Thozetella sp. PMI_491]
METRNQPRCQTVTFTNTVTTENTVFADPPDLSNETAIIEFYRTYLETLSVPTNGTASRTGTFSIDAVYCQPSSRGRDALQILVHGVTYNKTMWSGYGYDPQYDWHKYANGQGYHSLAIDRVGFGLNRIHPEPLNFVQLGLGVEVAHKIIQSIRTGFGNPLPRTFQKLAYVGHSYGSEIGTLLAGRYPDDLNALVITGFTVALGSAARGFMLRSAANVADRFAGLSLGYLTFQNTTYRDSLMYGGSYDHALAELDGSHEDMCTVGEIVTAGDGFTPAIGFKKPVLAVTGASDSLFCDLSSNPDFTSCEEILAATQVLFPNATTYQYYAPPSTGHTLTLHYTAQDTFQKVHEFLNAEL